MPFASPPPDWRSPRSSRCCRWSKCLRARAASVSRPQLQRCDGRAKLLEEKFGGRHHGRSVQGSASRRSCVGSRACPDTGSCLHHGHTRQWPRSAVPPTTLPRGHCRGSRPPQVPRDTALADKEVHNPQLLVNQKQSCQQVVLKI